MNPILFAEAISEIKSSPRLSIIQGPKIQQSKKKLGKMVLPTSAIIFFVCSLLSFTFIQVNRLILGYSIARLEQQQDQLLRDLQAFKLEEAVLKRPERIKKMAFHELNLIPVSKAPVIRLP